ncbi:MAG TPA: CRISPR-associated helicase Cas3' [Tepidisphaeraceae bacterium]|nr:CRISPR-associated helicase Cas3' [Tepidisphaeraceae bacterium]
MPTHAAAVAGLARQFASPFGAGDWGELLGRWHDLGKRSAEFQAYIRRTSDPDAAENEQAPGRVDHSTFGAQHAAKIIGKHFGHILAYCIAGHHGNLPDGTGDDEQTIRSTLQFRLKKTVPFVETGPEDQYSQKLRLPFALERGNGADFQIAFFTRMLYSALIDADRTATEQFCDNVKSQERNQAKPSVGSLSAALDAFLKWKQLAAEPTAVNRLRASVLTDCLAAASHSPGFFALNVPTGGGKTFASLSFALHHVAMHGANHGMRRVIVSIPFTSIIEQTADAYREALGSLATTGLVEHHSNIDPKKQTRNNQLSAENWDAPLIVTTNVQLYESLFAAATTPCRKLHRLAGSVIILDEAQTVPVELLRPTLMALKELVAHYNCTVVLCTATQPALQWREEFEIGISKAQPIIRDEHALFNALKRVHVERLGTVTDDQLIDRLADERAVLCIVNTRPHAANLYDALVSRMGVKGCYHLSTSMCAQHRRDKLAEIRRRLKDEKPCRLISTQLIEAGVDVDFPAVYRAPAGFDAIAQAAGRCNREGRLRRDGQPILGRVYTFDTETPPPPGLQRSSAQSARELIGQYPDPLAPAAVEAYFRLFYWSQQDRHKWDKPDVMGALSDNFGHPEMQLKFKTAAQRYKIIRDEQTSILVPYNDEARRIRDLLLRNDAADYALLRSAQRYLVGVQDHWLKKLVDNQLIAQHESGLWWLTNERAYSPDKGMSFEAVGFDPDMLSL